MLHEYAVVILKPNGETAVAPFIGTFEAFYFWLMDFYLDTDEQTEGGMPHLVYTPGAKYSKFTVPSAAPIPAATWLDLAYPQIKHSAVNAAAQENRRRIAR
jgi:hypothetical protein